METILCDPEKLHTTELGQMRIRRNLGLPEVDAVELCRKLIADGNVQIQRKGKNYYVMASGVSMTVNTGSMTIITAHKIL